MTSRIRKRDLRTRVTYPTHERVRVFAAAHQITTYQAAERLVLLGLDGIRAAAPDPDSTLQDSVVQISARLDALSGLADRCLFGALVAYAYARAAALQGLDGEARQNRDRLILEAGQEAYQRQLNKVLEK